MAVSLAGYITRDELGLADLELFGATPYQLLGGSGGDDAPLRTGQMVRENRTAESDFVDGAVLVHSRVGMRELTLALLVFGDSAADVRARTTTLVQAVSQVSWQLHVSFDAAAYVWSCWPADWAVAFDIRHVTAYTAQVNVLVPAQPDIF